MYGPGGTAETPFERRFRLPRHRGITPTNMTALKKVIAIAASITLLTVASVSTTVEDGTLVTTPLTLTAITPPPPPTPPHDHPDDDTDDEDQDDTMGTVGISV